MLKGMNAEEDRLIRYVCSESLVKLMKFPYQAQGIFHPSNLSAAM